jgi:hypothetical protein
MTKMQDNESRAGYCPSGNGHKAPDVQRSSKLHVISNFDAAPSEWTWAVVCETAKMNPKKDMCMAVLAEKRAMQTRVRGRSVGQKLAGACKIGGLRGAAEVCVNAELPLIKQPFWDVESVPVSLAPAAQLSRDDIMVRC